MPLVSVVIPTHNRADMLDEALKSVIAQSFREYEIIVVDDGSSDHTPDVALRYRDFVTFTFQQNQGRARARNAGIQTSRGAYLAFLDDDDVWYPRKLEWQVAILESRPDVDLVYGSVYVSNEGRRDLIVSEPPAPEVLIERLIFGGPRVIPGGASTVLVRRETLQRSGLFDPLAEPLEDWDLWARIALRGGRFGYVHEPVAEYRMHRTNTVHDQRLMQASLLTVLEKLFAASETPASIKARRRSYLSQQLLQAGNERYIDSQLRAARLAWCKALKLNPSVVTPQLLLLIAKTLCGKGMLRWARTARQVLVDIRSARL